MGSDVFTHPLPNSSYRLRLDVSWSTNVGANTTTFSAVAHIDKLAGSGVWTYNTASWSINAPYSTARNSGSVGGYDFRGVSSLYVGETSFAVAGSDPIEFTFFWDDNGGSLGNGEVSGQVVPPVIPAAPTVLTVARVSDAQQSLAWTNPGPAYTQVVVQRSMNDGAWAEVARPSGNATSFADTTTVANRKYTYRVAGVAGAGQSGWSNTAAIFTTPAAPSSVSAVKAGSNIQVTAAGLPPYVDSYTVQSSQNGGAFSNLATGITSFPYTHVAPNTSVTWTYRVISVKGGLSSAPSAPSNTVQLLAKPNAPTGLTPNGATLQAGTVRFGWTHNPVDTTAQTAYELRYRIGVSAWTTLTGTTAAFRDVALAANVTAYQWQTRTKGQHPDWSDWSAIATVTIISVPGVAVTQPGGVWTLPVLDVEWSYAQAESRPQSAFKVRLRNAATSAILETREGSGASTSFTMSTRLVSGVSYVAEVQAATGDVWSGWASQTVEAVFYPPAEPSASGAWDDEHGCHSLTALAGQLAPHPDVVNLYQNPRFKGAGTWSEIRRNLIPSPRADLAKWSTTGALLRLQPGYGPFGHDFVFSAASTPGAAFSIGAYPNSTGFSPVIPGVEYEFGGYVNCGPAAVGVSSAHVFIQWFNAANGALSNVSTTNRVLTAGWSQHIGKATAPAGAAYAAVFFWYRDTVITAPTETYYWAACPWISPPGAVSGYGDGVTPNDPDSRARWLGVANASISVTEIENVKDTSVSRCIAGVSTYMGNPAIRLIPTHASENTSHATLTIPALARPSGTVVVTGHQSQPLTGALWSERGKVWVTAPTQIDAVTAPNSAGATQHRLKYSALSSSYLLALPHGGLRGSGEVWYTDLGIFADDYDGPAFHGSTGLVEIDGVQLVTSWDGTVDNSASRATDAVPATVSMSVERSVDGGLSWEPVLAGAPSPVNLIDWEGLSAGSTLYRVIAYAASGAASTYEVEVVSESGTVWLSGGQGFATVARLPFNPKPELETGRERTIHRFAGRSLGVPYSGEQLTRVVKVSGMTSDDDVNHAELTASVRDLERLSQEAAPVHLHRDPDGRRIYGVIGTIPQPRLNGLGYWGYSYQLTETDH